jgi:hypothetical protein
MVEADYRECHEEDSSFHTISPIMSSSMQHSKRKDTKNLRGKTTLVLPLERIYCSGVPQEEGKPRHFGRIQESELPRNFAKIMRKTV